MRHSLFALTTLGILASATTQVSPRIDTDRPNGARLLKLPKEDDAFGFIVFGDRTGGPVEGIKILAQAVVDTNLLDPDGERVLSDLQVVVVVTEGCAD